MELLINHIKNNFVLYGFGSEPNAVWQCVRELVENSKDAIRKRLSYKRREVSFRGDAADSCIKITLSNLQEQPEIIEVQVFDNGIGMNDPISCVKCFSRRGEVEESSVELIGKYGVGLSTCVIYAQLGAASTNRSTRVITKTENESEWKVADFLFDLQTGYPVITQSTSSKLKSRNGTIVTACLPAYFSTKKYCQLLMTLHDYFQRSFILPSNPCTFDFNVSLANGIKFRQVYEAASMANTMDAETYFMRLRGNFRKHLSRPADCEVGATIFLSSGQVVDRTKEDCAELKISSILIRHQRIVDDDNFASEIEGAAKPPELELIVWRYINGTPMMNFEFNDESSCALHEVVTSFAWDNFGYVVAVAKSLGGDVETLKWSLVDIRSDNYESLICHRLQPVALYIIIDLASSYVSFSNLLKTCISKSDEVSMGLTSCGLKMVMEKVREQTRTEGYFMSTKDYHRLKMERVYIPSVAAAITSVIATTDECKRNNLLKLVASIGVASHAEIEANLTMKLMEKLLRLGDAQGEEEMEREETQAAITSNEHVFFSSSHNGAEDVEEFVNSLSHGFDPHTWRKQLEMVDFADADHASPSIEAHLQYLPLNVHEMMESVTLPWRPYNPIHWSSDEDEGISSSSSRSSS